MFRLYKIRCYLQNGQNIFPGHGFHTLVEWKIGYWVISQQIIIGILMMNTAIHMYDNIRWKNIMK